MEKEMIREVGSSQKEISDNLNIWSFSENEALVKDFITLTYQPPLLALITCLWFELET